VLNDPELMRQTMEAASNPERMRQMMVQHDRALQNIEAMPGGFNALSRLKEKTKTKKTKTKTKTKTKSTTMLVL
jgi:ubiquilin